MSQDVITVGGTETDGIYRVLAPNPGPETLEGTNTWVLASPGAAGTIVVDPGPDDPEHRRNVASVALRGGRRVLAVLLTHRHPDHAGGARRFAELTGAQLLACGPDDDPNATGLGAVEPCEDGEVLHLAGWEIRVWATPGHTRDSACFVLPHAGVMLTGDTVLGHGSTVIAHPQGRLADYVRSLERLQRIVEETPITRFLPGHGPVRTDPAELLREHRRHRAERLRQVRHAIMTGARTPREVVERVYGDIAPELRPLAELSVRAHLQYLRAG